jgi:hypothetical protein
MDCCCGELTERQLYQKEIVKSKNCTICDLPLVPIGSSRKNGKNHNDWDIRSSHKNCFLKKYGFPKNKST